MRALSASIAVASSVGTGLLCVLSSGYSAASPDDDELATQRQQVIVSAFAAAIVHDDHAGIAEHVTPDIVWTIPGSSVISGQATGIDGVIRLADQFAQYGLHISLQGYAFGRDTVAVRLHDNGEHNGNRIDQDVINVLAIRDDKIESVTSHFTDVGSFDTYFS